MGRGEVSKIVGFGCELRGGGGGVAVDVVCAIGFNSTAVDPRSLRIISFSFFSLPDLLRI